jgi:large subunit ribosomal protein L28
MANRCELTNRGKLRGNNVSHSKRRTKRCFNLNMQTKRFWLESDQKWVRLRLSTKAIRLIDKIGIEAALERL